MPRTSRIAANQPGDPSQVIADLRRQLAAAQAERDESLAQQAATAEVLAVINALPGDLAAVFDAVLEKAMRLCEADGGYFLRYEDGYHAFAAGRGLQPDFEAYLSGPDQPSAGSPAALVAQGAPYVHTADIKDSDLYRSGAPRRRAIVDLGGARTALTVPMRRDDVLLGTLNLGRSEVRPFTEKQIALLQNFAAQAVIAMENARLITETREALEQQTATAEVLGVINSSPGDLAPVFDAMLEKAIRLCDAGFGSLWTYDGEFFHAVAVRNVPAALAKFVREPHAAGPNTPLGRVVRTRRLVSVTDLAADEMHRSGDQWTAAPVELGGARSYLAIPLLKDDALVGAFAVSREEVRPFTDKQIALLENFAAQAVIAMENARLITETREALEQQTATAEVLGVINSSPGDLAPVFDAMLEKAMGLCGASFGELHTYDGQRWHTAAMHGAPAAFAAVRGKTSLSSRPGTVSGRMIETKQYLHIPDLKAEEAYLSGEPTRRASVDLGGIRTLLAVPLLREDKLVGMIAIYRHEVRPFSDKQIALLQNFAAQAVIAMENARLITETREALEQQTATAEVLAVINSSPDDLAPVFEAILDKAMVLSGAAFGALMSYDGEQVRAVSMRGFPPELTDLFASPFAPRRDGDAPYARFLRGEALLHIPDMAADDLRASLASHPRALVEIGGARTGLELPLRKDDALLGSMWFYRQEVRPFTDKQIALLQNFAAQAVIAMENARLITETREALEQQTATAEVLQVINSSPGDLAPVFDAMLDKASRLCEALYGQLYTWDGERFCPVAVHGEPSFVEWMRQRGPVPARRPDGGAPLPRIAGGERVVHVPDVLEDAAYRASSGSSVWREQVQVCGTRSVLTVALRQDDALLGALTVYRKEPRPFSDKQIALLQNFAAQAVIAMENARLITETREALEQQTATAEVLQVINASPGDLAPVFAAMLEKAMRLCEAAYGMLWTYDGGAFRAAALHGVPPLYAESVSGQAFRPTPDGRSAFAQLAAGSNFVRFLDVAAEEAYQETPGARTLVELGGVRTMMVVALRKDTTLLGAITAYRQEVRRFTDKQIALLQNFAAQAVIAMENARLLTETREALEQQTATAEVLQVINSSPGDLAPVFDAILQKAHTLCSVASGALQLYDGEVFRAVATHGLPEPLAKWLRDGWPPGASQQRVIAGEADVIHTADLAASNSPRARHIVEIGGIRTLLYVALRKDQKLLGVISASRFEVRPFSEKEIALLQNFAAQAVIAMENARLLEELRARTDEIAGWNRELEARVAAQLSEIERTGKLRRFLAPQLADLIVAQGDESILESHRREIVVVFCDLRGFTGFAERAEPEEVMALLRDYHAAMGPIVARFEGTLDHYAGDGIMVFFNDPLPTPDPARRAIDMAVAMRRAAQDLLRSWRRHGHEIGFGVGISQGYATLGQIGFAERMDYTAIGTVTNLAARLCAEAKDGQILVSRRVAIAVEDSAQLEEIGDLSLKGLSQAVAVYNVPQ
jgi:GAF domain-containing protein